MATGKQRMFFESAHLTFFPRIELNCNQLTCILRHATRYVILASPEDVLFHFHRSEHFYYLIRYRVTCGSIDHNVVQRKRERRSLKNA